MQIDTKQILSVTEANKNFSKAARIAEAHGQLIIFKNNKPKFLLVDIDSVQLANDDDKIDEVARRILERHKKAFLELAK